MANSPLEYAKYITIHVYCDAFLMYFAYFNGLLAITILPPLPRGGLEKTCTQNKDKFDKIESLSYLVTLKERNDFF